MSIVFIGIVLIVLLPVIWLLSWVIASPTLLPQIRAAARSNFRIRIAVFVGVFFGTLILMHVAVSYGLTSLFVSGFTECSGHYGPCSDDTIIELATGRNDLTLQQAQEMLARGRTEVWLRWALPLTKSCYTDAIGCAEADYILEKMGSPDNPELWFRMFEISIIPSVLAGAASMYHVWHNTKLIRQAAEVVTEPKEQEAHG